MKEHAGDLFDRIKTSKNLPSLPHILLKLIETCDREDSTIKEISQIINKDSSLTAKVLKMVNSAYYGLSHRVTSIDQALVLLGIDAVKNISISASVNQAFSQVKMNALFDLKIFWRHSLTCAVLAKLISKKVSYPSPDEAFLSGLLHDIGKLLEYAKNGGEIKKSYNGSLLRHPFSGVGLCYKFDIPPEVIHIVAVHSKEGDTSKRTPEAIILHHMDFVNFEPFFK